MVSQVTNRHHIKSILHCLINLLSGLICNDRGLQKVIDFIQSFFSDSMAVEGIKQMYITLGRHNWKTRRFINEPLVYNLQYHRLYIYQLFLPLFSFVVEANLRRMSMTHIVFAMEKKWRNCTMMERMHCVLVVLTTIQETELVSSSCWNQTGEWRCNV